MSRTRKNYLYNLITQLISFLIPVITTPYISRILGENNVGVFSYIQSVVSYFILVGCLGLNSYGQREIAYHQEDLAKKTYIFWELTFIRIITICIVSVIYIVSTIYLFSNKVYYLLFGIEILANMLDINWFYMGNEEFRIQFTRSIVVRLVYVISIFLFVKSRNDLNIYIICYVLSMLLGNFVLWMNIKKKLTRINIKGIDLRRHFKSILVMFLPQLAINIYTQLNKTMLGVLTGYEYEAVAYFAQGDKIIKLVITVITSFGVVMLSKISNAIVTEGPEKGQEYLFRSYHYMSLMAWPMACGLFAISDNFVIWFFGEGYLPVTKCIKILSASILFISTSNALGIQYLVPTNKMKEYNISIFIGLVTNIMLNFLLIPKIKEIGACISNVVSELLVMVTQIAFLKDDMNLKKMLLSYDILKIIISSLLMGGIVFFIMDYLGDGFASIILGALIGIVVYSSLLLATKESIASEIIKGLKELFLVKNERS